MVGAPVALAEEPPAIHAPPTTTDAGSEVETEPKGPERGPGFFVARGVLALGGGSSGIGGLYGAEIDVWPIRYFGIGIEFVRGGTTGISFDDPAEHDSFQTERLRLSGRFAFRRGLAVLTLAGGTGRSTRYTTHCPRDLSNCDEFPDEGLGPFSYGKSSIGPTGAIEGGIYLREDEAHVGLVVRVDVTEYSSTLTIGPAVGVEF